MTGSASPAVEVALAVEAQAWHTRLPAAGTVAGRAVRAALDAALAVGLELPAAVEVTVLLADDRRLRQLNARWRGQDKPTNVLSFPDGTVLPDGPECLGDLALALETLEREADGEGKRPADHLAHLVIHGVLHLLGWDHEADEAEAEEMEDLERRALAGLGIDDPYADGARDPGATCNGSGDERPTRQ